MKTIKVGRRHQFVDDPDTGEWCGRKVEPSDAEHQARAARTGFSTRYPQASLQSEIAPT